MGGLGWVVWWEVLPAVVAGSAVESLSTGTEGGTAASGHG